MRRDEIILNLFNEIGMRNGRIFDKGGHCCKRQLVHCGKRTIPLPQTEGMMSPGSQRLASPREPCLGYTSRLCKRTLLISGIKNSHLQSFIGCFSCSQENFRDLEGRHFIYRALFFLTSLLEYNCFTVLCYFLLYNKVNHLYIYIYPHFSSLLRLPLTIPIPPLQVDTKHHQLSILHLVVYISPCHSLTSSQLTLPPPHALKSILYICVFIPVLPLGSSEPLFLFLDSIYICVSIQYLFFSF